MFPAAPLTCVLILCVCVTASKDPLHLLSDEFIKNINSMQSTWTAGHNFHKKTSLKYIYRLMGTHHDNQDDFLEYLPHKKFTSRKRIFKRNFDARNKWSYCPTINDIRDQGDCGSCWAVAAVSAMTDRLCIRTKGKKHFYFSAEDVLSCCKQCGTCDGGKLYKAWYYYKQEGIVSGGSYNSSQGCKPYEIPPCEHGITNEKSNKCEANIKTPVCNKICNENYQVTYKNDKHRGYVVYKVKKRGITSEIYNNGPVTSYFNVYEDFLHYKKGVYQRTTGKYIGSHSVKLIGWGREQGVKYWLAANSWGTDWGDNGFFKIIRGNDYGGCGIENNIVIGKGN